MKTRAMVATILAAGSLTAFAMTTARPAHAAQAERAENSDLWLHVKVNDAKDGGKVSVNLPIAVVRGALAMVPDEARHHGRVRMGDDDMSVPQLRRMWAAVQNSPDATFVTVDDKDSKVRVAKRGGYMVVRADDSGNSKHSRVDVKIPATVVEALLSGSGDELNVTAAIEALARHGSGELVTVDGDDDTVRVWVDRVAESR